MSGFWRRRAVDAALWCAVAFAALVALAYAAGALHEGVDLLGQFAAPAFTVAVAAALLALAARRPRTAAAGAGVSLALSVGLSGQWFPSGPPPNETASPLVLYFANVGRQTTDFRPLAASVRAAGPDVVVLVEVDARARNRVLELLPDYPHVLDGSTRWDPRRGMRGKLVLSRHPMVKAPELDPARATPAQRRAIVDRITAPGHVGVADVAVLAPQGRFRLVAAHVHRPWPFAVRGFHAAKIDSLVDTVARGRADETVLVGDFNAPPAARNLRRLARETRLRPAPAALGTWPAALPAPLSVSLDNAFVGDRWRVTRRKIGRPTGSDHRPVVLTLQPSAD